jgi:hypothetical protein
LEKADSSSAEVCAIDTVAGRDDGRPRPYADGVPATAAYLALTGADGGLCVDDAVPQNVYLADTCVHDDPVRYRYAY